MAVWILIIALLLLLSILVTAAAIASANDERRFNEIMARWGVDRQLIDTRAIDEVLSVLDETRVTTQELIEYIHELNERGLDIGLDEDACENALSEIKSLIDEYENAEAEVEDRYYPDNTDFM